MNSVAAEVLTGPGKEAVAAGTTRAESAARINLRWFPGLTEKMRIVWNGSNYNIHSIELDETGRREYRLKCTASPSEPS